MAIDRPSPNFSRLPMLWLAVAFAGGILVAHAINIDLRASIAACILFAIAAVVLRKRAPASILILAAFIAAGHLAATLEMQDVGTDRIRVMYDTGVTRSGDPVEIEGVLLSKPEPSVGGSFLSVRTQKLKYHGNWMDASGVIRLFVKQGGETDSRTDLKSEISDLKYGSRITAAATLEREDEYLNPGVTTKRETLDRMGIDATGTVKSPRMIEKIADEAVFLPLAWVYDARSRLIDEFQKGLWPKAAGVMIASLLGDKYFLDKETADLFRDGGTFHILVISGLHITFIGGLLLLFMRAVTRNRWIQFGVTAGVLWAYTLAVGADVPVVRASIMFTVVLYSYVIYRQSNLLNSLGLCGIILLVWRPSDVLGASFLLTFASVASIVVLAYPLIEMLRAIGTWTPTPDKPFPPNVPPWLKSLCETLYWNAAAWSIESKQQVWTAQLWKTPYLEHRLTHFLQSVSRFLVEGILVSFIVQICMLPLSVLFFHRVSVASVLLNIWVGVFIAIESFAAVIGVMAAKVSILLAAGFFAIADASNWLMLALPRLFSDSGMASFRLPAYVGAGKIVYFLFPLPIFVLAFALKKWKPFEIRSSRNRPELVGIAAAAGSLAVLAAVIVFHPFSAPRPDGRLHIDFLDVGQGDSALVTFPDGRTLLVDGGGRGVRRAEGDDAEPFVPDARRIGEAVVSEFLWYRGYSAIDHILATHADADHIQGLADVARNFSVRSAFFGRTRMTNAEFAAVAVELKRRAIPTEVIERGDQLRFGDVTVEVLYPAEGEADAVSDNDHSVVLRIVYGNRAFLLTGDIERTAENALVSSGGPLAADLIKVPHHGSRTSSTQPFIDSVGAKYAVISVGRRSQFGHPHDDVVQRWLASGADVRTTGSSGTISISTDGNDLLIRQFCSE